MVKIGNTILVIWYESTNLKSPPGRYPINYHDSNAKMRLYVGNEEKDFFYP